MHEMDTEKERDDMDVRTFRARTMPEALRRVRRELGPDASVLHTREVGQGIWTWLTGRKEVEVTASTSVVVPSRFEKPARRSTTQTHDAPAMKVESRRSMRFDSSVNSPVSSEIPSSFSAGAPASLPASQPTSVCAATQSWESLGVHGSLEAQESALAVMPEPRSIVEDLSRPPRQGGSGDLSDSLFRLFADLIDAEVQEETARELVDRLRHELRHLRVIPGFDELLLLAAQAHQLIPSLVQFGHSRHVRDMVGKSSRQEKLSRLEAQRADARQT